MADTLVLTNTQKVSFAVTAVDANGKEVSDKFDSPPLWNITASGAQAPLGLDVAVDGTSATLTALGPLTNIGFDAVLTVTGTVIGRVLVPASYNIQVISAQTTNAVAVKLTPGTPESKDGTPQTVQDTALRRDNVFSNDQYRQNGTADSTYNDAYYKQNDQYRNKDGQYQQNDPNYSPNDPSYVPSGANTYAPNGSNLDPRQAQVRNDPTVGVNRRP